MNPSSVNKGIDWNDQPLGLMADAVLARRLGVDKSTVRKARKRRGLPAYQSGGDGAPVTAREAAGPDDDTRKLVAFCRKTPRTIAEVCDFLDCGPSRARELLSTAQSIGSPIEVHGDRLTWHLPEESDNDAATVSVAQPVGGWHQIAVIGDIHFGSKWCRHDYLKDFCDRAYERGVRTFLQLGDLVDGEYKHGIRELRAHGLDEQADECIEYLPRMKGAHWYWIDGNHCETFTNAAGVVTGQFIEDRARRKGRTDMTWLGQRRGVVRLDSGLAYAPKAELWHPKKGPAYALSYHLQKRCESYSPGHKPDFLFAGHWHQSINLCARGIHAYAGGCFQGQGSAYGNAIGHPPSLGSWIVAYTVTDGGTIRNVSSEWVAYYERETVRSIAV